MINRFLKEETMLTGSANDFICFMELYQNYVEWQFIQYNTDCSIITHTKDEFRNYLRRYPELYHIDPKPTYGIIESYTGIKWLKK